MGDTGDGRGDDELPLVGRDAERDQLAKVLDAAQRRGSAAAIISGEPGIGKTRVLLDLIARAEQRGWTVLAGGCDPLGTTRPFAPLVEALAVSRNTTAAAEHAARLIRAPRTDVASSLPVLAGAGVRSAVESAIVDAVATAAAANPVLLTIDDVQWADRASLATLAVLRRRQVRPLALVLARRVPAPIAPDISLLLDDVLAGSTATIALEPLDDTAVRAMAEAAGVGWAAIAGRLDRAGGNPLYVRALLDQPDAVDAATPRTLQRLVLGRLETVDADSRDLLRLASVLGSRFRVDDLAIAAGRPVVSLVGPLTTLTDAGMLVERPDGFAFRHEVVREAIYEHVPRPIREVLHSDIARSLDAVGAEPVIVAVHVARAPDATEADVAWLHDVARSVVPTAPELAIELLERVVDRPVVDDATRDRALVDLAEARAWGGDPEGAVRALDDVRVLQQDAVLMRARLHVIRGTPRDAITELEAAAERATSDSERAALLAHEAASRMFLGAIAGVAAPAHRALALIDSGRDDPLTRSLATMALGGESGRTGHLVEAVDLAVQSVAAAAGSDPANQLVPSLLLSLYLLQAADQDAADVALRSCDEQVRGTTLWAEGAVATVRAVQAFLLGRWDEALAWHERATAPVRAGIVLLDMLSWGAAAQIAARRGDDAFAGDALAHAEQRVLGLTGSSGLMWVMASRVALHEARNEHDRARDVMTNAWAAMTDNDLLVNVRLLAPTRVRQALADDNRAGVDDALAVVSDAMARAGVEVFATVEEHCQGMAQGDLRLVGSAVDRYERLGLVSEAANAAVDGASLAARHADVNGRRLLDRAEHLLDRLDARAWAASLGPIRRALGGGRRRATAAPRRPVADAGIAGLSEQERAIASLVADGLSNQQIADRLLLGKRTVDTYLWRIFRKAGVENRVELARLMTESERR